MTAQDWPTPIPSGDAAPIVSLAAIRATLTVCADRLTRVLALAGGLGEELEGATYAATYLDPEQSSSQVEAIQGPLALATAALHELAAQVGNARAACERVVIS